MRLAAVQLLTILLTNKPTALQDGVMNYPAGTNALMNAALDEREEIRNEALLLLVQLTRFSAEIQKAVVFDGAFDHIFRIVHETFERRWVTLFFFLLASCFLLLASSFFLLPFFFLLPSSFFLRFARAVSQRPRVPVR
eukprot:SAG31_NODE_14654_length_794_cov_1.328058_1_plen_138_part_00